MKWLAENIHECYAYLLIGSIVILMKTLNIIPVSWFLIGFTIFFPVILFVIIFVCYFFICFSRNQSRKK